MSTGVSTSMSDEPRKDLNWFRVGGEVRDKLLGRDPNDTDVVVIGHSKEDMLQAGFKKSVGESFSVFLHPETKEEWALGRTEVSTGKSYKDVEVDEYGEKVSLKEDLGRRDLTINAMAEDPETGEIIDPYNGQQDLEDKILRHVSSESFSADPLRILRLAMFAARLQEFSVHPETIELAKDSQDRLETLDEMRVYRNLLKMLRKAESPRRYFEVLDEVGGLETLFPELHQLKDVPAGPQKHHKEGSAFEHTMRVLEAAHWLQPNNVRVLLAALSHDLGKGITPEENLPSHYGHGKRGVSVIEDWIERTKMENQEHNMPSIKNEHEEIMKDAAKNHMRFQHIPEMTPKKIIRFTENHDGSSDTKLSINEFMTLIIADSVGREPHNLITFSEFIPRLRKAQTVLSEITGSEIIEQFEVDPVEEGSKIPQLLIQERVKRFRELEQT